MDAYTTRQLTLNRIADLCLQLGVHNFVIAPGSRSAPLVTALAQCPDLTLRVVIDERSAGYVALGLAQQLRAPVGLLCTSGTAALNFAPAVTEAFYQRVPLLVFTADRPPEWIDQQDNQAIHQPRLYEPHVLASFELPSDFSHPDSQWHAERIVAQAITLTTASRFGPVHINAPLREPIYPANGAVPAPQAANRMIRQIQASPGLSEAAWVDLRSQWQQAKHKLIIAGMHAPDERLARALQRLTADPTVAVIADITANLYPQGTSFHHSDMILGSRDPQVQSALAPDLVVSFGGQVVSKYLKTLLRQHPPQALWQLWIGDIAPDTFQAMTHVIPMEAAEFFNGLTPQLPPLPSFGGGEGAVTGDKMDQGLLQTLLPSPPLLSGEGPGVRQGFYQHIWHRLEKIAGQQLAEFVMAAPFGEFTAVHRVMAALPADSHLQLGNSMAIRYANFVAWLPNLGEVRVNSNRGTSGIDGTVSTAVGAALATDRLTTLIVGDLAFFYDRNGLWHANVPSNLRIVLLNNHGGGIFDIIEGPNKLDRATQERFFLTPQPLTGRRTAEDHGLDYLFATDEQSLATALHEFFQQRERAAILEIESKMAVNTRVFDEFRKLIATLKLA